jgi:hypothetical protein
VVCDGERERERERQAYTYVYQLDPKGMPNHVVGEDDCALQSGVGPSCWIWVCNVESGNGNSEYLVGGLRNGPLDNQFVLVGENSRHS